MLPCLDAMKYTIKLDEKICEACKIFKVFNPSNVLLAHFVLLHNCFLWERNQFHAQFIFSVNRKFQTMAQVDIK